MIVNPFFSQSSFGYCELTNGSLINLRHIVEMNANLREPMSFLKTKAGFHHEQPVVRTNLNEMYTVVRVVS